MSTEVKVPPLPESVSEATVVTWHKQPGDAVARDENLVDIETDKVVLEVPAPEDGVLGDILKNEGDTVTAGEVVAILGAGTGKAAGGATEESKAESADAEPAAEGNSNGNGNERDSAALDELSPAVRRMVVEYDLDPAKIEGSGPNARITKEDVLNFMAAGEGGSDEGIRPRKTEQPAPSKDADHKAVVPPAATAQGERPDRRVPMTRLRQRIAERLVEAQQTAAMLTTFNEVNMQPVMEMRGRYKETFQKTHDVKLGFMSFFVKAAVEALKRFPAVNASIDGSDIIYHGYYDIGIAVSSPRGLVVPVLRDCDQLSMAEIEAQITDFGQRAKDGKLTMDDLTGGTFTITNGGVFGSMMSTPILNPPQSGILGMHATKERAVVENGEIVIRPMMYLAHSYDHRIIDGREAVQFLVTIKDMIEDPARLLLEV
ncbi:2-oxoglutarate dehydrogenase complex dihydrolipoyllysine-residue succinyltransferase [Alkalilimnicola sp. S0819]|uniref:2-oxoglutarate dehydrogenase complex dihydrolipoyllysine-residue succinyltransferase n=1 Tax=Alkalilimnicola sp. S0819 TaxID=2613922 RepID=UPI001261E90B|nr:2-oxoglutarate dehydrogenase complex dihydrolipoyllysine-residue succinyltransferase [Alkalilimnicola sp. S0819]KAB7627264.1 2-oxoglutarate dehydrogenase complex dihydrolipoyllysine-residue succinyltransferase [Alkalilimnicola sp. S0819]MPQ15977.1 2-oxoglutarate dehydrogenase complex dihydrolipoyllysine-residue succinyltransferase [Alkalilimnicola sp. S0819]